MCAKIQSLTVLGKKGWSGRKTLLEFELSVDGDECAHQLQLRWQKSKKLEMQAKLESAKHESVSEAPHASTRLKAPYKLPAFDDKLDDLDA